MSEVVQRLEDMESLTRPLPWPVDQFYDLPGDMFQLVYGLTQAWPMLKDEVADLEATAATVQAQNDQLHAEHKRLAHAATAFADELADLHARYDRDVGQLATELHATQRRLNDALTRLSDLPAKAAAAERVCESFTTTKSGSGGAYGFIDGAALDAWRATK